VTAQTHHDIRKSIRARIEIGEWELGGLIPNEAELAVEYGCARTTMNRALRDLASTGLIERKRKGGTRVTASPIRQARFEIPILRHQIEQSGAIYSHNLMLKKIVKANAAIRTRLRLGKGDKVLQLETMHLADNCPFAFEERYINIEAVSQAVDEPFVDMSANEWLVNQMPFSSGDVVFTAENAVERTAAALGTSVGQALFVVDRTTWLNDQFVTTMKLYHAPGYKLSTEL
jgi:GntR family histidine utilization transcriptional repressor